MSSVDPTPVIQSSITVDVPPPAATNHRGCLLFSLPATRTMASLRSLWTNYYPPGAFGEDEPHIPGSALNFTIFGLLALVEIKSQGNAGFPFETHPRAMRFVFNSLLIYALASAAEHIFSVGRTGRTSTYAIFARLARMVCLGILNQLGCQGFRNQHHQQSPLF